MRKILRDLIGERIGRMYVVVGMNIVILMSYVYLVWLHALFHGGRVSAN